MRSEMLVKPQARETLRCCTEISSVRWCNRIGTQVGRGKPRYAPSDCAEGARSISKHSRCVVNKLPMQKSIMQLTFTLVLPYNISVKVGDRLEKRCNRKTVS